MELVRFTEDGVPYVPFRQEQCLYCGAPRSSAPGAYSLVELVALRRRWRPDGCGDECTCRCRACGGHTIYRRPGAFPMNMKPVAVPDAAARYGLTGGELRGYRW